MVPGEILDFPGELRCILKIPEEQKSVLTVLESVSIQYWSHTDKLAFGLWSKYSDTNQNVLFKNMSLPESGECYTFKP